ncbi:MAG: hypothetical protein K6T91_11045 [Firmicutes bacterium]|nr:hypothetical protein [Bacillota bacterium]
MGPHCRNCHRGSSNCATCHNATGGTSADWALNGGKGGYTAIAPVSADNLANQNVYGATGSLAYKGASTYSPFWTSTNFSGNYTATAPWDASDRGTGTQNSAGGFLKWSRDVVFSGGSGSNWRTSDATASAVCADDGFSWPHRTLGYMMLKDDLFGLDIDGSPIAAGEYRKSTSSLGSEYSDGYKSNSVVAYVAGKKTHDIDSVCLDCHNPTIWNATSTGQNGHVDGSGTADDYNDELILRGLP